MSSEEHLESYYQLEEQVQALEAANAALKNFARYIIGRYCLRWGVLDSGEIQKLAKKLGLVEPHIATNVDPEHDDYEVGDTIGYRFAPILQD